MRINLSKVFNLFECYMDSSEVRLAPISWGDSLLGEGACIHLEGQQGMTQWIKAIYQQ